MPQYKDVVILDVNPADEVEEVEAGAPVMNKPATVIWRLDVPTQDYEDFLDWMHAWYEAHKPGLIAGDAAPVTTESPREYIRKWRESHKQGA